MENLINFCSHFIGMFIVDQTSEYVFIKDGVEYDIYHVDFMQMDKYIPLDKTFNKIDEENLYEQLIDIALCDEEEISDVEYEMLKNMSREELCQVMNEALQQVDDFIETHELYYNEG